MELLFVNLSQASKLKNLNYDEDCLAGYSNYAYYSGGVSKKDYALHIPSGNYKTYSGLPKYGKYHSKTRIDAKAPTYEQAIEWLLAQLKFKYVVWNNGSGLLSLVELTQIAGQIKLLYTDINKSEIVDKLIKLLEDETI